MAYQSWSVVFEEQPSVAKWNILGSNDASFNDGTGIGASAITPEKLLASTGTSWVWQSWTPSWTNLTIGNATVDAKYVQIGKMVVFRLKMTWGSTTSATGSGVRFSVPVTMNSAYADNDIFCTGTMLDTGVAAYLGGARWGTSTTLDALCYTAGGTYVGHGNVTSTAPFTWANGDKLFVAGAYEAA